MGVIEVIYYNDLDLESEIKRLTSEKLGSYQTQKTIMASWCYEKDIIGQKHLHTFSYYALSYFTQC